MPESPPPYPPPISAKQGEAAGLGAPASFRGTAEESQYVIPRHRRGISSFRPRTQGAGSESKILSPSARYEGRRFLTSFEMTWEATPPYSEARPSYVIPRQRRGISIRRLSPLGSQKNIRPWADIFLFTAYSSSSDFVAAVLPFSSGNSTSGSAGEFSMTSLASMFQNSGAETSFLRISPEAMSSSVVL